MQQGKMFFAMGLCMASIQGGYVRRIPHGKEITAAISVSHRCSFFRQTLTHPKKISGQNFAGKKNCGADLFQH